MASTSIAWLIVWLPLLGFVHNAFAGLIYKDRVRAKKAVSWVAPGVVLLAFGVTLWVMLNHGYGNPEHPVIVPLIPGLPADTPWIKFGGFQVNFGLLLDPLSMLMTMVVTGVGGLIHIYATGYMADDPEQPRFFTYFNLFIFMMLLLVLGENFLLMFVGWEGVGTCSYLLISFWYTDVNNAKAGNKAFIVNRVGDLGFALGMMAVWSVFGTLSFFAPHGQGVMQLAAAHKDALGGSLDVLKYGSVPVVTVICLLLFVGATGKSAQIPLWVWLPDAMAGPTPVSALIHAATMVTAGVVMVTRCSWLFVQSSTALQVVGWIGLATALLGATIGLVQNDIKRVLAFSTVSQLGYMFLACGVGAFTAGMFHVLTHAFFKALLFLGSGAVIHSMHGEQDMRRMGGLKKLIPRTYTIMLIGTLAIAGFPFLSGFYSKDEILKYASASPWGSGPILYFIGLGIAFLTAFYMMRLMSKTFYTEPRFENGKLVSHVHSNFSDDDAVGDAHGAHDDHTIVNPHGEQTGHEEANTADAAHGGHGHGAPGTGSVHESPPSMMFPLYVLALLSVVAGLLLGPTGIFERFLEPSVASLKIGPLTAGAPMFGDLTGWIVSGAVAIIGMFLAYTLYKQHTMSGELLPEAQKVRNPLYNFLMDKWKFDAVYNAVFIRFGGYLADHWLWRVVDMGLIDGTVQGVAKAVGGASFALRRVQTGFVRSYALSMLVGVVILVLGILAGYYKFAMH